MVHESVMATAARDAVVDAGGAVAGPVDTVVDDAPAGGHGAAWKGASTVAHVHRAANRRRDSTTGSAHVERFASAAQHDGDDFGVAGEATRDLGVDGPAKRQ